MDIYKRIADRAIRQGNMEVARVFRNPKRIKTPEPTVMFEESTPSAMMPEMQVTPPVQKTDITSSRRQNVMMGFMQEYASEIPSMPAPPVEQREEMQIGGVAGEPQEVAGEAPMATAPATIVGDPNQPVSEADSIADDVPVDVPEGSFVINQPAVDAAGLKDLIKKIEDAYDIAKREGIDISSGGTTMSKEDTVKLLVSKGELLVSPAIARIIGYETLEKINNRGEAEVERRQMVAEQQAQQPQNQQQSPLEAELVQTAARGGFISKSK